MNAQYRLEPTVLQLASYTLLITLSIPFNTMSGVEDDEPSTPVSTIEQDDDFGEPSAPKEEDVPMDDDFGEPETPVSTESMDDDFRTPGSLFPEGTADDDFGDMETVSASTDESADVDGEKKKDDVKKYLSATEAHITFLKALETEKRYPSAVTCAECHPDHYREWSVSAHSYAQMSPVFNTMHAAITSRTAGTNGDFCIRCHTQVGMQRDEPLFTSNLKRHPASVEGITCIVCHRVEKNYGKVSGRTHIEQGSIFEPVFGPTGNGILKATLEREDLKKKLNPTAPVEGEEKRVGKKDIHGEAVKFDPITSSGFCGSCHDVNLYNGFRLEEAFTQYKNSPAADKNQSCQDCHMGKVPGAVTPQANVLAKLDDKDRFDLINYMRGPGARISGDIWAVKGDDASGQYGVETTERKRTNHMFAGPDYSIIHPAIFPHSNELRQAMWEYERKIPDSDEYERVGMKHLLEFKWEDGWGDPTSDFEKATIEDPEMEKSLPWPWNDSIARSTLRQEMNNSFRLLNNIDAQRHQVMRRSIQFGDFKIEKNDSSGLVFSMQVVNATDGHAVPTGFDAERLFFMQVTVRDRIGRIVYESGDRDPNGDVRDLHSKFVHHHAEKSGEALAKTAWKEAAGLERTKEDLKWLPDSDLFSLQSKFITRNHRGGEREQILAVNYSVDPLPYIRPDTRPGILVGKPASARKQARGIPPLGSRTAEYKIDAKELSGEGPYTANFKFICQMVPINLISEIADQGFDYNLSPREVGKRVAFGHRVSSSTKDEDRRGGALTIWDKTLVLGEAGYEKNFRPTESEIMADTSEPFPYKDPSTFGGIGGGIGGLDGGISYPYPENVELPIQTPDADSPSSETLLPEPSDGTEDDSFE